MLLFGLSMDYHVFIISRIREAFDRGLSTEDAVVHGIKTTRRDGHQRRGRDGRSVLDLRHAPDPRNEGMAIGPAAAVLIDATVVRGVLLPATMKLLGDYNWYLPSWLRWLPRVALEAPAPTPARSPKAEPAAV